MVKKIKERLKYGLPKKDKRIQGKILCTQEELAKKLGVSFASVNRWGQCVFEPAMKSKAKRKPIAKMGMNSK